MLKLFHQRMGILLSVDRKHYAGLNMLSLLEIYLMGFFLSSALQKKGDEKIRYALTYLLLREPCHALLQLRKRMTTDEIIELPIINLFSIFQCGRPPEYMLAKHKRRLHQIPPVNFHEPKLFTLDMFTVTAYERTG